MFPIQIAIWVLFFWVLGGYTLQGAFAKAYAEWVLLQRVHSRLLRFLKQAFALAFVEFVGLATKSAKLYGQNIL